MARRSNRVYMLARWPRLAFPALSSLGSSCLRAWEYKPDNMGGVSVYSPPGQAGLWLRAAGTSRGVPWHLAHLPLRQATLRASPRTATTTCHLPA